MIRFLACAILILVVVGAFLAQQPPQSAPWDVTMQTNTVADSTFGDPERKNVEDSSRPQYLDPDKVDKWLRDFLEGELNKLKLAEKAYADFVKNCK